MIIFREQYYLNADERVLNFFVNISTNSVLVVRKYTRLQTLAATVGGLFNIMVVFGSLISSYFEKHKLYEEMINSLFIMEEQENSETIQRTEKNFIAETSEINPLDQKANNYLPRVNSVATARKNNYNLQQLSFLYRN